MAKWRYSRVFKRAIVAIVFGILLFGAVITFFVVSAVQYNDLVAHMTPTEATVVDIDWDIHYHGPSEQRLFITYEVDGAVYSRELETDAKVSFSAGRGANYAVGDTVEIFYDPQDPEKIASPRSMGVGVFYLVIGLFGMVLVLFALFYMVKKRRTYLVTQEEYEKGKAEQKRKKKGRRS